MRIRVFIDPDAFFFETDGVDDQSIAVPAAKLFAEERRIGIVGMLAIRVDWNQPIVGVPVKERDLPAALQDLERQPAGVMTRNSADDAETLRIDGRRQIVLQRRLARRG